MRFGRRRQKVLIADYQPIYPCIQEDGSRMSVDADLGHKAYLGIGQVLLTCLEDRLGSLARTGREQERG